MISLHGINCIEDKTPKRTVKIKHKTGIDTEIIVPTLIIILFTKTNLRVLITCLKHVYLINIKLRIQSFLTYRFD